MKSQGFERVCAAMAFALVMASVPVARSQSAAAAASRAAARKLGEDGIDAYLAGQMPVAVEKLEKAFTLYPTSSLGLWSARALVRSGRWVEGAERYREGLRAGESVGDPATQKEARREAEFELDALQSRAQRGRAPRDWYWAMSDSYSA